MVITGRCLLQRLVSHYPQLLALKPVNVEIKMVSAVCPHSAFHCAYKLSHTNKSLCKLNPILVSETKKCLLHNPKHPRQILQGAISLYLSKLNNQLNFPLGYTPLCTMSPSFQNFSRQQEISAEMSCLKYLANIFICPADIVVIVQTQTCKS